MFRALQSALATYARPSPNGEAEESPILDKRELVAALEAALAEVRAFATAQGFKRIGLIDEAIEAILVREADKKQFLQMASRIARLFKAILPDPLANDLAPLSVLVAYLAAKIRADVEPPDIRHQPRDLSATVAA